MTIETLIKHCLQYLEQDAETEVMESSIDELKENDTFKEYLYNIHHSIYMGLVRYVTSKIVPLKEFEIPALSSVGELVKSGTTERLFHEIKDVYGIDEKGNLLSNVPYLIVGYKVILRKVQPGVKYYVLYYPTINDFSNRANYYRLDLQNEFGIPDEMAINIKYLVYSDMKMEENPNVANINRNYFENYLSEMQTRQINNNQVNVNIGIGSWGDSYGNSEAQTMSEEDRRKLYEEYLWG